MEIVYVDFLNFGTEVVGGVLYIIFCSLIILVITVTFSISFIICCGQAESGHCTCFRQGLATESLNWRYCG